MDVKQHSVLDLDVLNRAADKPAEAKGSGTSQAPTLFDNEQIPSANVYATLREFYGLSNRECDVVAVLCRGKTNKKMAEALFVTEKTIKFHLTSIYKKAEVKNRLELFSLLYPLFQGPFNQGGHRTVGTA